MSIKQTGARLWFETQAEIDDYDTLMIANIELKSEDYNDENFTIVATRKRKEIMPGNHTSLFNKTISDMEAIGLGKSHIRLGELGITGTRSLLIKENYYLRKSHLNWLFGYLFLRELPIRNFYARSMVMSVYALNYISIYGLPVLGYLSMNTIPVFPGFLHGKERRIFHWFQETDRSTNIDQRGEFRSAYLSQLRLTRRFFD